MTGMTRVRNSRASLQGPLLLTFLCSTAGLVYSCLDCFNAEKQSIMSMEHSKAAKLTFGAVVSAERHAEHAAASLKRRASSRTIPAAAAAAAPPAPSIPIPFGQLHGKLGHVLGERATGGAAAAESET